MDMLKINFYLVLWCFGNKIPETESYRMIVFREILSRNTKDKKTILTGIEREYKR